MDANIYTTEEFRIVHLTLSRSFHHLLINWLIINVLATHFKSFSSFCSNVCSITKTFEVIFVPTKGSMCNFYSLQTRIEIIIVVLSSSAIHFYSLDHLFHVVHWVNLSHWKCWHYLNKLMAVKEMHCHGWFCYRWSNTLFVSNSTVSSIYCTVLEELLWCSTSVTWRDMFLHCLFVWLIIIITVIKL